MFEFPCIVSLYYIKNQQDATLAVLFISHCKITLHVYPVRTSKVGSLLHCSGNYYSFSTPDDGRGKRPKHVE